MKTVLIVGDDGSVPRALGEVVERVFTEARRGPTTILTASSDDEVFRVLSRDRIDLLMADYSRVDRSCDLIGWIDQGKFPMKTLLVAAEGQLPRKTTELRAKGIDAALRRPVRKDELRALIQAWFQ
jgi:response regulator of citrate/malate metabolism